MGKGTVAVLKRVQQNARHEYTDEAAQPFTEQQAEEARQRVADHFGVAAKTAAMVVTERDALSGWRLGAVQAAETVIAENER